jgi:hypothetical protein
MVFEDIYHTALKSHKALFELTQKCLEKPRFRQPEAKRSSFSVVRFDRKIPVWEDWPKRFTAGDVRMRFDKYFFSSKRKPWKIFLLYSQLK